MAPGSEPSSVKLFNTPKIKDNATVRKELALACRALDWYRIGVNDGIFNHVSALARARDGDGNVILLVPYGILWKDVTPECLAAIDTETGKVVEGKAHLTKTDIGFHLTTYRRRPECTAIFHCHPTYATTLCCLEDFKVRCISVSCIEIINEISYDRDFSDASKDYSREFDRWFDKLGDSNRILMMGNHGVSTIGGSVAIAFDLMVALEQACQTQITAMTTGGKLKEISQARCDRFNNLVEEAYSDHAQMHLDAFDNLMPCKTI